jgi:hypothetical protein
VAVATNRSNRPWRTSLFASFVVVLTVSLSAQFDGKRRSIPFVLTRSGKHRAPRRSTIGPVYRNRHEKIRRGAVADAATDARRQFGPSEPLHSKSVERNGSALRLVGEPPNVVRYLGVLEAPRRSLLTIFRPWASLPEWHAVLENTPSPITTLCGLSTRSEAHRTWDLTASFARCLQCERLVIAATAPMETTSFAEGGTWAR